MRYVALVGRILFSAIFIIAGFGHFTQAEIGYAAQQGVPFASLLVPASGVMAVAGGLSILVGYYARVGAVLVAVFLVPVTLALVAGGHTIVSAPIDGPFGRTFTFADPDGYQVTLHDRA